MIVGYIRVSVDNKTDSIQNQILLIKEYAKYNNLNIDKFYIDNGCSGMTFFREGFQELKSDIELKKVDTVIVKDISRLGRDSFETSYYINEFFVINNVKLISLDYTNDAILINIRSIMNEQYVKDCSIKRKCVAYFKTMNHEFIGPKAPYGYRIDYINNKRTLVIEDSEALIVRDIFNKWIQGYSLAAISDYLNSLPIETNKYSWNSLKLRRMLENVVYKGDLVVRKSETPKKGEKKRKYISKNKYDVILDVFPSIISKDIFELANCNLKRYTNHKKSKKNCIFENLIFCGECNIKMHYYQRYKNNKYEYYYKCLTCSKTIFLSKLNRIIDSVSYELFNCVDKDIVINKAKIKVDYLLKSILCELLSKKENFLKKNKELYMKKNNNDISELEFLKLYKTNVDLIESIDNSITYINNYNFDKEGARYSFSFDLKNFIDRIEVRDYLKIFVQIKKA